jgi:hypothetical protein
LSKRSISVKALVEDISKGLSDAELMHKHGLSHVQLQRVFAQLIEAGYVGREVLEGRKQQETKPSSVGFGETDVPAVATESRSSGSPRPVPRGPHSTGILDPESSDPATPKSCSPSLPLSREEASRLRRHGLILILASYAFVTVFYLTDKLQIDAGFVFLLFWIGWIVTAIWGCLWRVRGLGQNAAWAIVAPVLVLNLLVVEALPNRYEPQSFPKVLWVALAVGVLGACGIALAMISRLL